MLNYQRVDCLCFNGFVLALSLVKLWFITSVVAGWHLGMQLRPSWRRRPPHTINTWPKWMHLQRKFMSWDRIQRYSKYITVATAFKSHSLTIVSSWIDILRHASGRSGVSNWGFLGEAWIGGYPPDPAGCSAFDINILPQIGSVADFSAKAADVNLMGPRPRRFVPQRNHLAVFKMGSSENRIPMDPPNPVVRQCKNHNFPG